MEMLSIRDQLKNGIIPTSEKTIEILNNFDSEIEILVPEDNYFCLKEKARLERMIKSTKARQYRKMIKEIKNNRHQLGYSKTH